MHVAERITFLINSLGGGGAEGVCVSLANGFAQRGWKVTLVVLHLEKAVRDEELCPDVNLLVLGRMHARTALFALWQYLRVHRPERVLAFNHQLAVGLVVVRSVSGLTFSIIARNINTLNLKRELESSFWHKHVVDFVVRTLYKKVDHVIAQSQGMREDLLAHYGFDDRQITQINNPLNPRIGNYLRLKGNGRVDREDYLLCVGRLEQQKAFHFALEAFSRIAPEFPRLRLKLVGDGSLKQRLIDQARTAGISEKIDFTGFVKDVAPYYLHARATVLTSDYEGFPNVLIESICLGTPVVAFDCPSGPREIVQDGVNGYLVRYRDADHLENCLRKVLNRDWDSKTMAEMVEKYRIETVIEEYLRVCSTTSMVLKSGRAHTNV